MFWKAQAEIINDDALARDISINTFHFITDETGTPEEETADIDTHLRNFYSDVDTYLSSNVKSTQGLRIKQYNHEDAPPRVPFSDTLGDLTPGGFALPNEVAICVSYYQNPASGVNRRRQRGRIYFGPLTTGTMDTATGDVRVASAVRTAIADAAHDRLINFVGATSGSTIQWCVFSRSDALGLPVGDPGPSSEPTYTNSELVAGYHPIDVVYVDDAFDTQRRRGLLATARTTGA